MSNQKQLPIRVIMSGSCHPHSGKIISFLLPADDNLSVRQVIDEALVPNWPQDQIAFDFASVDLILLKEGRRMEDSASFCGYFSATEMGQAVLSETNSNVGGARSDHSPGGESKRKGSGILLKEAESHNANGERIQPLTTSPQPDPSASPATKAKGKETTFSPVLHLVFRRKRQPKAKAKAEPEQTDKQKKTTAAEGGCCQVM
jgi:hypothetical protein